MVVRPWFHPEPFWLAQHIFVLSSAITLLCLAARRPYFYDRKLSASISMPTGEVSLFRQSYILPSTNDRALRGVLDSDRSGPR